MFFFAQPIVEIVSVMHSVGRRFHIDTHKLPLRLPVRLAHGHQKIHSLSDLLQIRRSERILMQMLQNATVDIL